MTSVWNETRRNYDLGIGPHRLIEDQVAKRPDAIALVMGRERVTYRELDLKANQLAHFLREQGIQPGGLVGVYLDRSLEMVVALLAILKAGGAYFPLDPKFPQSRLAFMLEDAEARVLLTQRAKQDSLPPTKATVVAVDAPGAFANLPRRNLSYTSQPSDVAYVIYTSGRQGTRKGYDPVQRTGQFLARNGGSPGICQYRCAARSYHYLFRYPILELLLPLTTGGQVVAATREQASDAEQVKQLLTQHGVTVMQATPTTWRMLVESGWEGKSDLKILCGGEALAPDLARQLLPKCRELWNMYGPTETTIWSSAHRIVSADEVLVGPPMANTQFYVADEKQRPVPAGITGELLIGGQGVALGYLKRPELTAAKFVPDTLGDVAGGRLYRTGDEVRMRPDGRLQFIGRIDDQVKLRGFRIELGEVEAEVSKIEGVRRAVAVLREDHPGDPRLVAYYAGSDHLSPEGSGAGAQLTCRIT